MKMPQHPRALMSTARPGLPLARLGVGLTLAACSALAPRAAIEAATPQVAVYALQEPAGAATGPAAVPPAGPARPIVTVLDFDTSTLPDSEIDALSQALWSRVASDRRLAMLPREATRRWLIRNDLLPGLPYAAPIPLERVTSALRSDYLISGRLDRLETSYVLQLSVFDGHTRQLAYEAASLRKATLAEMVQAMEGLAGTLNREVHKAQASWLAQKDLPQAPPANAQPAAGAPAEMIAPPDTPVKAGAGAKQRLSKSEAIIETPVAEAPAPKKQLHAETETATHAPQPPAEHAGAGAEDLQSVPEAHEPVAIAAAAPAAEVAPAQEPPKHEAPAPEATAHTEPAKEVAPKASKATPAPEKAAPKPPAAPAEHTAEHAPEAPAQPEPIQPDAARAPEEPKAPAAKTETAAKPAEKAIVPPVEPKHETAHDTGHDAKAPEAAVTAPEAPAALEPVIAKSKAPEAPKTTEPPVAPAAEAHKDEAHGAAPAAKTEEAKPETTPAANAEPKVEPKAEPKPDANPAKEGDPAAARKLLEQAKKLERGAKRTELLQQAAAANPADAEAWRSLAGDQYALKQFDQAVAACDAGLKQNAGNSTLLTIKSSALFELKQFEPALQASRAALEADPKNNWARYNQALALMQQGAPDEAKAWNDYIEHAEKDKDHAALLANARWRLDDLKKAKPAQ